MVRRRGWRGLFINVYRLDVEAVSIAPPVAAVTIVVSASPKTTIDMPYSCLYSAFAHHIEALEARIDEPFLLAFPRKKKPLHIGSHTRVG